MRIITYNVNGIRATLGKGLADWIKEANPDVLCIQETKAQQEQMPMLLFQEMGYRCYNFSAQKKGYSGVAILCKQQPDNVVYGMNMPIYDNEGRFLRTDFGDLSIVSVYHPSGSSGDERQAFKMQWLEDFSQYVSELRKTCPNLILCGDYNICHKAIDIHNPISNAKSSGFLPEEREWMDRFIASGFIDTFRFFNQEPHQYSWWSFRGNARAKNLGWRIDYNMATENLAPRLKRSVILSQVHFSDHCPVLLEIE
ncbi:MAG: exodeoxyribonuclease III [Treponema sp.]|nr:exodeoxyribonuclease III [Treponema sp.]